MELLEECARNVHVSEHLAHMIYVKPPPYITRQVVCVRWERSKVTNNEMTCSGHNLSSNSPIQEDKQVFYANCAPKRISVLVVSRLLAYE